MIFLAWCIYETSLRASDPFEELLIVPSRHLLFSVFVPSHISLSHTLQTHEQRRSGLSAAQMTTNTCIDFTSKLMMKERTSVATATHHLQLCIYSCFCLSNHKSMSPFVFASSAQACSLSGQLILVLFNTLTCFDKPNLPNIKWNK